MIRLIEIRDPIRLEDQAGYVHLSEAVRRLRMQAEMVVPRLQGRKVWMVSSTEKGGGVAEMMPKLISILRELGIDIDWGVAATEEKAFFPLTKRIHNLIHDSGEPGFDAEDKDLYDRVSRNLAGEMARFIDPGDILVVHDPQPLGMGSYVKQHTGVPAIWRCHIGVDRQTQSTDSAWKFLKPYAEAYEHAVFSAAEYIPPYLAGKTSIIYPSIDPLGHKNRELSVHKLIGILTNAAMISESHPVLTPPWRHQAMRLQPDGRFAAANTANGMGLLYRPIVTQISRWDRLKGWEPLLKAFLRLKKRAPEYETKNARHKQRLEIARLVFAGPDPSAVQDDPEGQEVLESLIRLYQTLDPREQESVAILTLPMASRKQNHLMVNAIQRCSTVVVQNSIEEGFGLTATEAMWKRMPVLASSACGLRQQIRDGIDGRLTRNPNDPEEIAENLNRMLSDPVSREMWGRNAQRRVHERFLVFSQVEEWLQQLAAVVAYPKAL
ncbi:MAG: glycosyltransferase [Desulfobacteraceae bacterium]|nr:MAG: glycosyltransferase [Desulfobacteraceae bacterium]